MHRSYVPTLAQKGRRPDFAFSTAIAAQLLTPCS